MSTRFLRIQAYRLFSVRAANWAVVGALIGVRAALAAPAYEVEFRDQPCQTSRAAIAIDARPWTARHRQDLQDLLDELAESSPGFVQRACFYRKPLLYLLRSNPYPRLSAFSDVHLHAIFLPEQFFERRHDWRLRVLAHELAHLANVTKRLNHDPAWIDTTSAAIARMNESLKDLGLDPNGKKNQLPAKDREFREHKAELDALARSQGLPGWYAATSSNESIAEVAAAIASHNSASVHPRLVEIVREALFGSVVAEQKADRYFHNGLQAFSEGRGRAASGYFDEALQHDPSLYEAGYLAACAQAALRQWPDVIERCDKLLARYPADAELRTKLLELRNTAKDEIAKGLKNTP